MATGVQVWSQTAATNATADGNVNYAEGQAPSSLNDSARAAMSSVAKWRDDLSGANVTAGTSLAFTLVTNQVATALTSGFTIACAFHKPAGAAATIAVDGLAAKQLQINPGTNLLGTEYSSGSIGQFTYSSTGSGQWIANTPPSITVITTANVLTGISSTVALAAAATTLVSLAQGTLGTWLATATVTAGANGTLNPQISVTLTDGTNTIATSQANLSNVNLAYTALPLSGVISSPAGNIRITASQNAAGITILGATATQLTVVRLL